MIRLLLAIAFIVLGGLSAPYLLEYKGYLMMSIGHYTIETTMLAFGLFLLVFWCTVQLVLVSLQKLKRTFFDQMELPKKWRQKTAHQATIKGLGALAESNWQDAEKLLAGHAKQSEMPVFNYLAAAHAAHLQHHFEQRDKYLDEASQVPDAQSAVRMTRTRYLLEQDVKKARQYIDKLRITEDSSETELKLAWFTYSAQKDYAALVPLANALKWHKIIDKDTYKQIGLYAHIEELSRTTSQEELDKVWSGLGLFERRSAVLKAKYIELLYPFNGEAAKEMILAELKQKSPELLELLPRVVHWEKDEDVAQALLRLHKRNKQNAELTLCIARLCVSVRSYQVAQEILLPLVQKTKSREHTLLLGEVCENMGDVNHAMLYYKEACS